MVARAVTPLLLLLLCTCRSRVSTVTDASSQPHRDASRAAELRDAGNLQADAALSPAAQLAVFEAPLANGWCASGNEQEGARDNCFSLRVLEDRFTIDARTVGPYVEISLAEYTAEENHRPRRPIEGALTVALREEVSFAVARVIVQARSPSNTLSGVLWDRGTDGMHRAYLTLELYRGDRAYTERWLGSLANKLRDPTYRYRHRCQREDGLPRPLYTEEHDLDEDGTPEYVCTTGGYLPADWQCRRTVVLGATPGMRARDPFLAYGELPRGFPWVRVVTLQAPERPSTLALSTRFQCCNFEQEFTVHLVRNGTLQNVFDNRGLSLPGVLPSRSAQRFAAWRYTETGESVLIATDTPERYALGNPASLVGFHVLRFNGTRFIAGPPLQTTPNGWSEEPVPVAVAPSNTVRTSP